MNDTPKIFPFTPRAKSYKMIRWYEPLFATIGMPHPTLRLFLCQDSTRLVPFSVQCSTLPFGCMICLSCEAFSIVPTFGLEYIWYDSSVGDPLFLVEPLVDFWWSTRTYEWFCNSTRRLPWRIGWLSLVCFCSHFPLPHTLSGPRLVWFAWWRQLVVSIPLCICGTMVCSLATLCMPKTIGRLVQERWLMMMIDFDCGSFIQVVWCAAPYVLFQFQSFLSPQAVRSSLS